MKEILFELLAGLRQTEITKKELEEMRILEEVRRGDKTEKDYLDFVKKQNETKEGK